jgi:hypothetical protein
MMTLEQMEKLYNATPFTPFIIHLADGNQIPVPSREFISAAPTGWTMVVWSADGTCSLIDVAQITRAEIKPQPSASQKRRRG